MKQGLMMFTLLAAAFSGLAHADDAAIKQSLAKLGVQAALAAPDLLKPNLEELEQLTGNHPESDAAILDACRPLLARGTALVAVTLGGEGAVLVSRGGAWRAQALPVTVQSTVGSGDAFTAALALGLQRGMETEQLLALAAAAGAVNAMTGGTDVPDGAQIRAMAVRAQLRRLA